MPRGHQLTRPWYLLQLLDRPSGVAVDGAARDLDCTVRTIWRDLRVLQDAGFPIYDEPGADGQRSVWRVDDTFKQRLPLKLSLGELAAGRLEMTLQVADTLEVRRWILGFGSEAEVREPSALREALGREGEALAQKLAPQRLLPASIPLGGGTAPLRAALLPS
jgi:predicted DNA-binding transcriptional regulator YafY